MLRSRKTHCMETETRKLIATTKVHEHWLQSKRNPNNDCKDEDTRRRLQGKRNTKNIARMQHTKKIARTKKHYEYGTTKIE